MACDFFIIRIISSVFHESKCSGGCLDCPFRDYTGLTGWRDRAVIAGENRLNGPDLGGGGVRRGIFVKKLKNLLFSLTLQFEMQTIIVYHKVAHLSL